MRFGPSLLIFPCSILPWYECLLSCCSNDSCYANEEHLQSLGVRQCSDGTFLLSNIPWHHLLQCSRNDTRINVGGKYPSCFQSCHRHEFIQVYFLAATKQLYEWFSPSFGLSACLSVRHTFFTMFSWSWNFHLLSTTNVMSMQKVKVKGQRYRGQNPT